MPRQEALTVIADIKPEARESLENLLGQLAQDPARNTVFPFAALSNVHFARFLVLPESTDPKGKVIPAKLVFSTNVDGSVRGHIRELVKTVPLGLDEVFGHCYGYPSGGDPPTDSDRRGFLRRAAVKPSAFYVNTIGRSVEQVLQEDELRKSLEKFIDDEWKSRDLTGGSPSSLHSTIRSHVQDNPNLRWALRLPRGLPLFTGISLFIRKLAWPVVFGVVGALSLPILPLYVLGLRIKEKTDATFTGKPSLEHVQRVSASEDHYAQNPFSGVGYIKPGLIRNVTVRVALRLLDYAAKHIYNDGSLTGVTTIHFARWIIVDNGRRTLFMSNYDGSLESYMSDFIDKVAWGLNLVFSNGVGWPRTAWLIKGGAERELEFKNFLRSHQLPTQVYYSAYPHLTAVNIANNAAIRRGLTARSLGDPEAQEWLRRF